MKTPDEIKRALDNCSTKKPCPSCPMWEECKEAASLKPLWDNALTYIQQLEAANAELLEKVEQLEKKCHQLELERDAAVEAIKSHRSCIDCKHSTIIPDGKWIWTDCPKRDGRCLDKDLWEWRGVKEE